MASCGYCSSSIIFGGVKEGGLTFCNEECAGAGALVAFSNEIPADIVEKRTRERHEGTCPNCSGRGPVDVHNAYSVWSFLVLTSWATKPLVGCGGCGARHKLKYLFFSGICGWWGFPWGLIMTPIQVVRNITALFTGVNPGRPSEQLQTVVRLDLGIELAEKLAAEQQNQRPGGGAPMA